MPQVESPVRLWWTADRQHLVPEGHTDAAFLALIPGRPLTVSVAEADFINAKKAECEAAHGPFSSAEAEALVEPPSDPQPTEDLQPTEGQPLIPAEEPQAEGGGE